MRIGWKKVRLITTLFLGCYFVFGVSLPVSAQKVVCHFNQLTTRDGLSGQEFNHFIHQDTSDHIWINSLKGLNRYDGNRIASFIKSEYPTIGLLDNMLNSPFFEDQKGNLWFSSTKGIHRLQLTTEAITAFMLPPTIADSNANVQLKLVDIDTEEVWANVDDAQLVVFPANDLENAQVVWEAPEINYRSIICKGKNSKSVWFFSHKKEGLLVKQLKKSKAANKASYEQWFFKGQRVYTSLYLNDSTVWVGLENGIGLVNINNQQEQFITSQPTVGRLKAITSIIALDDTHLLVATQQSGVFIFNTVSQAFEGKLYQQLEGGVTPFEEEVEGLYRAPDGVIWISVNQKGVFFTDLNKIKFDSYYLQDYPERLNPSGLKMLTATTEGHIWGISEYNVFIWDKDGVPNELLYSALNTTTPFAGRKLYTIFCDRANTIWLGTEMGLYYCKKEMKSFQFLSLKGKYLKEEPAVTAIYQLQNGQLLVSTSSGILQLREDRIRQSWEPTIFYNGFDGKQSTITWIYEDIPQQRIFVNDYSAAITILDLDDNGQIVKQRSIPYEVETSGFIPDIARNRLWIPSADGLMYLSLDTSSPSLQSVASLSRQPIQSGQLDDDDNLWLTTSAGLAQYLPDEEELKQYSISDGVQGNSFLFGAAFKMSDGKLLFGGGNGFTIVGKEKVRSVSTPAKATLNQLLIKGLSAHEIKDDSSGTSVLAQIKSLTLPYEYNQSLFFGFAPKEYSDPGNTTFEYVLIKNQKDTIDQGIRSTVRLVDVRPGSYQLQVYGRNSDGLKQQTPYLLAFTILQPWWQSGWFYLLLLAITVFIMHLFAQYRIKKIKRQEAALRERAEIEAANAEMETAILRLQMSPHFLFNSMNSIGGHILSEEPVKAYTYLTQFAKLMRKILEDAEKPTLSLREELQLMEQYLKIEQMRFGERLSFQFDVAPTIDQDAVHIPTMLSQPFLENAIKHGLANQREGGRIMMNITEVDQTFLRIVIEDNGVGRQQAHQRKRSNGHVSKAMDITSHRLQLLEEQTGLPTQLLIEDVYPNEEWTGTRVILEVPLLDDAAAR
ncbi:MAG: histidine kinase [Bacteroidota bacterium]